MEPPAPLSQRTAHLREASILRALTTKVQAYADGINLGQGVCDLDMPRELRLAAVETLFKDRATYTNYAGVPALREQIVRRMNGRYGVRYQDNEVVVTVGASMAYTATLMTLLDPGDEIVLFEPFYPYHFTAAKLAGAEVRALPMGPNGEIPFDGLRAALGPRTKFVLVNTPSNPLGKVWSRAELDQLADVLAPSNAYVVTDEIYEDMVYDGLTHIPPAAHPRLFDRTITISGLSKAFSITGWRLGWICAPQAVTRAIGPVFDVLAVCAPRPLQQAAAVALRDLPASYYEDLRRGYEARREVLCAALERASFQVTRPHGAYYVLADYRQRYGASLSPLDACYRLLEETRIAAIPGTIFFSGTPQPVLRFQFAVEDRVLAEAARRLSP